MDLAVILQVIGVCKPVNFKKTVWIKIYNYHSVKLTLWYISVFSKIYYQYQILFFIKLYLPVGIL